MRCNALVLILKVLVADVIDGDTVKVAIRKGATPMKIRLHGIDAPELDQDFGPESKGVLEKMVLGKTVMLDIVGVDRFGRQVGILYRKSPKNSFNKLLVELGMAYNWPRYGMLDGGNNAQVRARKKRDGIWQRFGGEVRPWSHRHGGTQTPIEYTKAKLEQAEREKAEREAKVEKALALLEA